MEGRDFFLELLELNKAEQRTLTIIYRKIVWKRSLDSQDYVVHVGPEDFATPTEMVQFYDGYRKLLKKDTVRRVGKATYMINPKLLMSAVKSAKIPFQEIWANSAAYKEKQQQ